MVKETRRTGVVLTHSQVGPGETSLKRGFSIASLQHAFLITRMSNPRQHWEAIVILLHILPRLRGWGRSHQSFHLDGHTQGRHMVLMEPTAPFRLPIRGHGLLVRGLHLTAMVRYLYPQWCRCLGLLTEDLCQYPCRQARLDLERQRYRCLMKQHQSANGHQLLSSRNLCSHLLYYRSSLSAYMLFCHITVN